MSLFDILEERMQGIFEGGNSMAPLPFKKLAKEAVRQMKRSSVKVDGNLHAPTLYTVLVNPEDDAVIAPLYQQVTDELIDFVGHEAQNGGYALMANPLVRFIPDKNVKRGKQEIVAEVVTPEVLDALRREEAAYCEKRMGMAGGSSRGSRGMAMAGGRVSVPLQQRPGAPAAAQEQARPAAAPARRSASPAPEAPRPAQAERPRPAQAAGAPSCELVETSGGHTWRISAPSTVLGRDEQSADLVLKDTNVSRRHAELVRDGAHWKIRDLGSTNGTRVNGMRVTEQDLASGDEITMGLITLEFREL